MSHTIGRVEQDNPQSDPNTSQDNEKYEETVSLADKDYEFLFNQLLEGISHGWHEQRIVKFFGQLSDRGTEDDWVAWLERLRPKVISLPIQSKRQLGTLMIRLGELTQSTDKVKKIGATSNRLGRELLFGSTGDIIWEYAGPDLVENQIKVETEEELSNRLPTEFTSLSSPTVEETSKVASETTAKEFDVSTPPPAIDSSKPNADQKQDNDLSEPMSRTNNPSTTNINNIESEKISSQNTVLNSEEFEFELLEPLAEETIEMSEPPMVEDTPTTKETTTTNETIENQIDRNSVSGSKSREPLADNQQQELLDDVLVSLQKVAPNSKQESLADDILVSLQRAATSMPKSTESMTDNVLVSPQELAPESGEESLADDVFVSLQRAAASMPKSTESLADDVLVSPQELAPESGEESLADDVLVSLQRAAASIPKLTESMTDDVLVSPQELAPESREESLADDISISLQEAASEPKQQESLANNNDVLVSPQELAPEFREESLADDVLASLQKAASELRIENSPAIESLPSSNDTQKNNSESVSLRQVMSLIQEDEELASAISQKLNISRDELAIETSAPALIEHQDASKSSSIELIESWFNLGLKQVSAGEFTRAIASWEKALKINPNLSEAWHNRGSALGRLGEYDLAIESFQNALAIDPNNYQAWNDYAHALYQLQYWADAVNSWNNALKIMPANHLFWYNRGCGLEQLGNWDDAIASYEKSLEIKPDFQPARSRYVNLIADNSHIN